MSDSDDVCLGGKRLAVNIEQQISPTVPCVALTSSSHKPRVEENKRFFF